MIYVCNAAGHPEVAIPAGEKASVGANPRHALGIRAFAYAQAGEHDKAEKMLAELAADPKLDIPSRYYLGLGAVILGKYDEALDWLEGTFVDGLGITAILSTEPLFEPLRSYPRYQALLAKLNLPTS